MRSTLMTVAAGLALAACGGEPPKRETYALVHAIGNAENVAARGLSKAECESRKADLKATATALGTYNEARGFGSITCLPEGDL
jgi:hypothetical protein